MTYAMRLNGGELIRDGEPVKHDGFTATVMREGTRFGNGEPLVKTLNTLMTNGSWEKISRFGNRSPALIVKIEGETPDGLNAGGVWLSKLMGPGALEWLPPDQTVWTVFDVVSCYVDLTEDDGWDFKETQWIRKYRIPIKALPHSRSQFPTITPATPLASTPIINELVTGATTLTGWTAGWNGDAPSYGGGSLTPTVVDDAVHVDLPPGQDGGLTLSLTYATGPVPAETPILRVDYKLLGATSLSPAIALGAGGVPTTLLPILATAVGIDDGVGTAWYRIPPGTRSFMMRAHAMEDPYIADAAFEVDEIRRVSRLPDSGTDRQKVAAIIPGGSAPAVGSLHVSHPTEGLGQVLVHTYPLGRPSPALMEHRTSTQTPDADTAAVNGGWVPLNPDAAIITVPESMIPTRGRAALWAKVRVEDAPVQLRWTITPLMGGEAVGDAQTEVVTVPVGESMLVPLGLATLPGANIGTAGELDVRLEIDEDDSGDGLAWVDDAWAFGQDEDSALAILDCGTGEAETGGPANHLWINAPTAENPTGDILIGTNPTDAHWPQDIQAGPEVHKFGRDGVGVLTVTCGAPDASTDFAHFKRWDHFAAEES